VDGRRAVFLDRDGVLVETLVREQRAFAPVSLDEFRIVAGAGPLVARLRKAGLLPIVFTNQPDVGRGRLSPATLAEMHIRLRGAVPVEDIFVCVHDGVDGCECRKPKPGMLRAAAEKWAIDLRRSFVLGDRWQDIDAGRAVGCYTVLIERPYSGEVNADARAADLAGAVQAVLACAGE
jgi:D-glycero-D-manno-heptose 1,7-bisphosphate phosphatase